MQICRIIFERGLEVGPSKNGLRIAGDAHTLASISAIVHAQYGVRPILYSAVHYDVHGRPRLYHRMMRIDGSGLLSLDLASIDPPEAIESSRYKSLVPLALSAQYVASATVYHCEELTLRYAELCDTTTRLRTELSNVESRFSFSGCGEGYFEFDALITAARRTYDATRYILWAAFGPERQHVPSNFIKTVQACKARLPTELAVTVQRSWDLYGRRLTAYRDCIQHYVPVSFGVNTAQFKKVADGSWSVSLRIPDNPEARSSKQFTFRRDVDALTNGWEIANEVVSLAASVFRAIPA